MDQLSKGNDSDSKRGQATSEKAPASSVVSGRQSVQRKTEGRAERLKSMAGGFQSVAAQGTSSGGGSLPHLDRIQAAFGSHDVSGVQSHVGGPAAAASDQLGAQAYASGNHVAFKEAPSLHTAAHEAAHVVQQRGGVQLKSGLDTPGDAYEQQADAVADAVVSGRSAEGLLNNATGGGGRGGIQRKSAHDEDEDTFFDPAAHMADMAGPKTVDAKAHLRTLRPSIEAAGDAERARHRELSADLEKVEGDLKVATEEAKVELAAKKAGIDKMIEESEEKTSQIHKDLGALDNPATDAATANEILARQKAFVRSDPTTTLETHDNPLIPNSFAGRASHATQEWSENRETTVTSEYDKGAAKKKTEEKSETVGLSGYNSTQSVKNETLGSTGSTAKDEKSNTLAVGRSGVSLNTSQSNEQTDAKGKTEGSGRSSSFAVGPSGASSTTTATKKDATGEKTTTSEAGLDRGDGKLGFSTGTTNSVKNTDKSGSSNSSKTTAGVSSGEDGVGMYASHQKGVEKTSAKGLKAGAVGGMTGGVNVNVTPVKDSTPPKYEISISINIGANVGGSAGYNKEGKGAASVGAKLAASGKFGHRELLGEEAATAYLDQLKASNGGSPAGPDKEMAIIAALGRQDMAAARALIDGVQAAVGDVDSLEGMKDGQMNNIAVDGTAGVDAKGSVLGVGLAAGYEKGHGVQSSVEKKGDSFEFKKRVDDSDKLSGGLTGGAGPFSAGISGSHTNKSARGYTFSLSPKDPRFDPTKTAYIGSFKAVAGELQAAGNSQSALDAFAGKYPWAVLEKTTMTGTADEHGATMGLAGVKVGMKFGNSLENEVTEGPDGKREKVTGTSSASASLSLGDYEIGASSVESAVAEVDEKGNSSLDVTDTDTDTNPAKWLGKNVPFSGEPDNRSTLQKLAGAKQEGSTDDTHAEGIAAGMSDLAALSYALKHGKWMEKAPRSLHNRKVWLEAGKRARAEGGAEAAVAKALAWFMSEAHQGGADELDEAIRDNDGTGGSRYELPEGLGDLKGPYSALVIADPAAKVEAAVKVGGAGKGVEAAKTMIAQLDGIHQRISNNQDAFTNASRYGEMLASVTKRIGELEAKVRVLNGGQPDELTSEEWKKRYNDLLTNCMDFQNQETNVFSKIKELSGGGHPGLSDLIELEKDRSQLRELHQRWRPIYEEMAGIAQDHNFGMGRYWKFKPDSQRLARTLGGAPPGEETTREPETKDLRKKPEKKIVRAPADPVGDQAKEHENQKKGQSATIQSQVAAAQRNAEIRGRNLHKRIHAGACRNKPMATDAHNRGMAKLKSAQRDFANIPKNATDDAWLADGELARQGYNAAVACFEEGLTKYA